MPGQNRHPRGQNMARTRIIDISEFNTVTDWDAVKKNVDAVIIRALRRDSRSGALIFDKKYIEHRKACKTHNIPYSLYYFTEDITEAEAIEAADMMIYTLRDIAKYIAPVFIDTEHIDAEARGDKIDKNTRTACVKAFCNRLQAAGIPAGIYSNTSWLNNQLDMSQLPFSIWVAEWGTSAPSYTGEWTLWQYTNKGSIDGVSGNVDISTEQHPSATKAPSTDDKIQTLITQTILLAEQEVGYLEKKSNKDLYDKTANAGDMNYTKYGYEMSKLQSNMDFPAAWCDCFYDWLIYNAVGKDLKKAKMVLCGDIDDYTVYSANYYKMAGRWYTTPQAGDQIFFTDKNGAICHTGIVTSSTDSTVNTIEGNTSSAAGVVANGGCVRRKSYSRAYKRIAGYGRPNWAAGV